MTAMNMAVDRVSAKTMARAAEAASTLNGNLKAVATMGAKAMGILVAGMNSLDLVVALASNWAAARVPAGAVAEAKAVTEITDPDLLTMVRARVMGDAPLIMTRI